jgi:hypothetical protein
MKKISPEVFTYYKKKLVYAISKWDIKDRGFNDVKLENYIWENGLKPWDSYGLFEEYDEIRNYILEKNLVTYNEKLNLWFVSKRCRKSSFCREYETLYNLDKGLTNTVLRLNEIASDCGFSEECADNKYFYPKPGELLIRRNSSEIKIKVGESKMPETYYKYYYRLLNKQYCDYFFNVEELNDY